MRLRTRIFALGLALGAAASMSLSAPRFARAQGGAEDKAAAEALFDEGKRLFLQKKYADACPRLESSQRLDPGIGTLLYLADCYEGMGRVASAWATFREAASAARTAGQSDRERIARGRAARLEPNLFKLTFAIAGTPPAGLKIRRNDVEVRKELWGTPVPIDPGAHTIEVTAPGKKPWSTKVDIPSGAGARAVPIPELVDEPVAPAAAPPKDAPVAPAGPPGPDATGPDRGRNQRIAGFAVGGVGLGGVLVGSVFGALALSRNSDAKKLCDGVRCSNQEGVDSITGARTAADVSTVTFIAGGVAVAAGLVLVLTAPSKKSAPTPSAWVLPMVGGGTVGVVTGRTF